MSAFAEGCEPTCVGTWPGGQPYHAWGCPNDDVFGRALVEEPLAPLFANRKPAGEWQHDPAAEIRTIAHVMSVHPQVLVDNGIPVPGYTPPTLRRYPLRRRLRTGLLTAYWEARRRLAARIYPPGDCDC
jgi:hypothetical protein